MPNSYYTPPTQSADGETADAADVNTINTAVDAAFDLVETAVDAISTIDTDWATLAQGWAETAEDVVVPTQPAGSYSALHYSAKASEYADNASSSASTASSHASSALSSANSASASSISAAGYAANALSSQNAASNSASTASSAASSASGSASTASTHASNASADATTALSAASSASGSAISAAASAALALSYKNAAESAVAGLPSTSIAEGTGIDLSVALGVTTITVDLTELDVDANVTRPGAAQLVGITDDCTAAAFIQIDINADMDGWVLSDLISANSTAGVTGSNIVAAYKNGWTTGTLMATSTVASAATQSGAVSLEAEAARTVAEGDQVTIGITTIHSGTAAKGCNVTFSWNG
jgi:hypothetical protein